MKHSQTHTTADMDLWGQALAARLNGAALHLDHDISERLRIARQRALQAQPVPQRLLRQSQATQTNGTLTAAPEEGLNLWRLLVSTFPLLALILGLLLIQDMQQDMAESSIASLDSALLLDELPPAAYTDPGFVQFLKQQTSPAPRHD